MERSKRNYLSISLISLGLVVLLASAGQVWWPNIWYWWTQRQQVAYTLDPVATPSANIKQIEPVSTDYGIVITKIGVNEAVKAGVNPFKPSEYLPVLQKYGVAEAKDGAEPGQIGTTYLFGHSTVNIWEIGRYHAPFTLLDKLENGDVISVFYKDQRYDYQMVDRKVVSPKEVHYLTDKRNKPTLIIQTCDPPGENSKRLLVIAELISD